MFGIAKGGDGEYFDSLAAQFRKGPEGNKTGLAQLESAEYQEAQWVTFLRKEKLPKIRQKVILNLLEKNTTLQSIFEASCEAKIKEKSQKYAQEEMTQNPPSTLLDKRFLTFENLAQEYERFLRSDCMGTIRMQVALSLYDGLPEDLKKIVDQAAEEEIQKRAREEVRDQEIEKGIATTRAVILNGGIPGL